MTNIQPAVPDKNWLEPEELYLARGEECEIDRPLFQGDIFTGVPLPGLPKKPPAAGKVDINFSESIVMIIPHPCQCYHGDKPRPFITVAPVRQVFDYDNFGDDKTGNKDKFALPDLMMQKGDEEHKSFVADFGKIISVPQLYLPTPNRIACLSHMGLGLVAKRFIQFQSRLPSQLAQVMALTQDQWQESFLMQAWVRRHQTLKGFTAWMRTAKSVAGIADGAPIIPYEYITSSPEELIQAIKEMSEE
ncbi:hypothetical protein ACIP8U_25945 [Streptomyces pseudovenezuelae]|uniref:hypothetical protein n=1 Tax=Streptomyces pseudovenezuelae TaxID=67350 RepID=UPI0036E417E5